MIITCNNCHKKFDVDPSLIPEKGRLLQCSGCDHKWFFKKEIVNDPVFPVKSDKFNEIIKPFEEEPKYIEIENSEKIELLDKQTKESFINEKIPNSKSKDKYLGIDPISEMSKNKKNYNILGFTIVFIISFIALIIVLDTFQSPISKIVPDIEFLLYSLYETINDIKLFLKDLI